MALRVLRKLWNEKPELVGSSFMGVLGVVLIAETCRRYVKENKHNRRYRETYTVIRHDDPKVATLRKDYLGDM
ncbi:uncharacterized protein LOC123312456 [Coccinella septempunctata]|uniref:uncharacterized protein LOC123312456 n=1 Tax=Coccinella septempunctata TaxID=41139 RepID=UPI001D07039F|nr:uncharacterized protein LOC123312456 [Coccinella septempunctata]